MSPLDSVQVADTPTANQAAPPSTALSLEGNPGPGSAPPSRDRGHSAHAGNDHPQTRPHIGPHAAEVTTMGIDVSEFQNTIDWNQVQSAGVKFAYIRATDGTTIQDADFVKNWQGAEKAGIPVGAYHFFTTTSPVQSQITNFVSTVKQVDSGKLAPFLDVEDPTQFEKFTVPERVAMIQQWLDGVQQQLGVKPMLYMSSNFSSQVLNNAPQFNSYKLFVADYTTDPQPIVPQPWTNWDFWQHADNGKVAGITGDVDMDYFHGPESSLPVIKPAPPAAQTVAPPEAPPPATPPVAPPKELPN